MALLSGMIVTACSNQATAGVTPSPTPSPPATPPAAAILESGCGSTPVYGGSIPKWLDDAVGHNSPGTPFVITHPPIAGGFLFTHPLRAGHPTNPGNKVLWAVGPTRNGSTLYIDVHPFRASSPNIHEEHIANSGPGNIYPDGVDVPTAGCWQFDLRWATYHAQVELNYTSS